MHCFGLTMSDWNYLSLRRIPGSLFALGISLLLIYLVLAGQHESWITPISGPLALPGTVRGLTALGPASNIYIQISLVLLTALAAKNANLAVEIAREERDLRGRSILKAAVLAAITRFRPILMASFALHPRRDAAGLRVRRRRQLPQIHRHCGRQRGAGFHLHCRGLRAEAETSVA